MRWIKVQLAIALVLSLIGISNNMNAQTKTHKYRALDGRQQSIVRISALTATGDLENLRSAVKGGLDSGLTINEIKDVLVQMYAYCGFPRSLNGISTFMSILEERKKAGVTDVEGRTSTPIIDGDKYERGRKTLEKLTGQPQSKPAPGFGEFSPTIDRFLKEHLFADIFDSDVLSHQQRELATISALAAMTGVQPQLESHLSMAMNTGLTKLQLQQVFDLIEESIGKEQADTARRSLAKVAPVIFPKGENAPADYFTGTVYLQILAQKTESNDYSIGSVTFEPGARSNWHTHPAGQTLIVISGRGLYQERGKPMKTINKGETIICPANVEHWHGASPDSQMNHIAITNDRGAGGVVWLKPVTDEEYDGRAR